MRDVIALRAGACHNGRIGDGRAMVAADRAGHARAHADYAKRVGEREYREGDRDQYAEGAPACAGREREAAGNEEYDERQEGLEPARAVLDDHLNELLRAEGIGHGL